VNLRKDHYRTEHRAGVLRKKTQLDLCCLSNEVSLVCAALYRCSQATERQTYTKRWRAGQSTD